MSTKTDKLMANIGADIRNSVRVHIKANLYFNILGITNASVFCIADREIWLNVMKTNGGIR